MTSYNCIWVYNNRLSCLLRGFETTNPLASDTVLGLNALSGIETGNTDGQQSITISPIMSAGFCTVRSGPSSTASDIRRLGREERCSRLADFGVDPPVRFPVATLAVSMIREEPGVSQCSLCGTRRGATHLCTPGNVALATIPAH